MCGNQREYKKRETERGKQGERNEDRSKERKAKREKGNEREKERGGGERKEDMWGWKVGVEGEEIDGVSISV